MIAFKETNGRQSKANVVTRVRTAFDKDRLTVSAQLHNPSDLEKKTKRSSPP